MTVEIIKDFLMWCSIIHVFILLLYAVILRFGGDMIIAQAKFYKISESKMREILALVLTGYKFLVLMFFALPYLILELI